MAATCRGITVASYNVLNLFSSTGRQDTVSDGLRGSVAAGLQETKVTEDLGKEREALLQHFTEPHDRSASIEPKLPKASETVRKPPGVMTRTKAKEAKGHDMTVIDVEMAYQEINKKRGVSKISAVNVKSKDNR